MNVLDWCLVALVGIYALSGYWQGFVTGAFATAGLLLGGLARRLGGAARARRRRPVAVGLARRALHRDPLGLARPGGPPVRRRPVARPHHVAADPRRRRRRRLGPQRGRRAARRVGARRRGLRHAASARSRRSCATPRSWPRSTRRSRPTRARCWQTFNNVVGTTFFPRYLEPFAPERIVAVKPGDPRMLTDPDVMAAEASVVKVRGANGCGSGVEGTGFFYAPGRLMTNAHVVAGVTRPEVEVGGSSVVASVVLYDADLDIAVLSVPDVGAAAPRLRHRGGAARPDRRAGLSRGRPLRRRSPAASAPSSGCARPTSTATAP